MKVSEEEKRRIMDLHFNQGKTIREVSKIMGKSSHDITPVTKEHRIQLAQNYVTDNREQNDDAYSMYDSMYMKTNLLFLLIGYLKEILQDLRLIFLFLLSI